MKASTRRTVSASALAVTTAGLMALGLGTASAHVNVSPASTTAGGYTQLNFSVPSESDTALTEKIEIQLPTDTPFTSVRAKPVEGWTAEVVRGELPEPVEIDGSTITEGVLSVVWTADSEAAGLSADEYQVFSLSVGRLPEAGTTVTLPAIQTYTDGSVSSWDEVAEEGSEEPDSPAPSFVTTAEEPENEAAAEATSEPTAEAAADTEPASASSEASGNQPVIWVALAAGLLGLGAGVFALFRTRSVK
ncbi:YcnI family copper-binding membrane protein [Arthrobacter sp. HLT1-21]